ncbi:MAG: BTAD domain-containing putative transcriptional regulator [Nocardioidaceae bacterium]
MLSLRILGSMECRRDGELVDLGGNRPKVVLALLALERRGGVGRDRIIDAIWDTDPPESAPTQVAIHISTLRKALGDPDVIETVETGYRIDSDLIEVDATRAERLIADARSNQRIDRFREALALWDGTPLDGLGSDAIAPVRQHLEELHLSTLEDWAALALDAGRERELIDDLPASVARHPLREHLRALLMEALWRTGRRVEALTLYDEGRRVLTDQLGIAPGHELARLHREILQDEPETDRTPATLTPAVAGVPRELPVDVGHFAGRRNELAAIDRRVADRRTGGVVALHGPGGAGKTALAVHWAHGRAEGFADGQLFVNLMGHGPGEPLSPAAALASLLRQVGISEQELPEGQDERARLLRNILTGRRSLVVLDNARDSAQIRPLLPGGANVTVVTSRSQLRSLATREAAHRIAVTEMPQADAVDLLLSRRSDTASWDIDDVAELARLCGNLPVALAVAAERANRYDNLPLAELNAELRDSRSALETLSTSLDDPAARTFRLIGASPLSAFDARAAGWLTGLDTASVRKVLDRLVERHLLTEARPDEYEMHDLVRAYASYVAESDGTEDERRSAVRRLRTGYLHSVHNARHLVDPTVLTMISVGDPPADLEPPTFEAHGAAVSWCAANAHRVRSVLYDAASDGDHVAAYRLAVLLDGVYGYWGQMQTVGELAEIAASSGRLAGDRNVEAYSLDRLASAQWRLGLHDLAYETAGRARALYRRLGDTSGEVHPVMVQGLALLERKRFDEAVSVLENALHLAGRAGQPTARFRNNLAAASIAAGRIPEAIRQAREAVEECRASGQVYGEAIATDTLAQAFAASGKHDCARDQYARAVTLHEQVGPSANAAESLRSLGTELRALGDHLGARQNWQRALEMLYAVGASDGVNLSRAELYELLGETPDENPPSRRDLSDEPA